MPRLTVPQLPLDGLLRRAAVRDPGGTALTRGHHTLTFAELDTRADRVACWLQAATRPGATVGVANTLDAAFPAAYYGTSRSGRTIALVNPLIGERALHHVFTAAAIETAFVPSATAELLTKMRDQLPRLTTLVVTDADDGVVPADALPLHLALQDAGTAPALGTGPADPHAVACLQFTTGTTGRPKGVRLTHRNLVANATQIALVHRLGPDSVTLNHLPLFHVMHLNSAVGAGAAQILCPDPDPIASLALAARTGATHYYGLPARLHRLAADPRLAAPREGVPASGRLTAVMSGGTALAPAAAHRIATALGVPVIQGYGMAELSPLSHNQDPGDDTRHGAVGRPLPGTDSRIVTLDTREPVAAGTTGEVQVRGPQLMAGYLDDDACAPIDAEGWFSTGDIGYHDEDGVLHLVDRLGDVFKYDNELVSPTAVERVLADDPRVAECVVVGWPDAVHGAVAWAGIVLHDTPRPPFHAADAVLDVLDSITEKANTRLAPFERIRRVEHLDTVPRTPTGKPRRRDLRRTLRARAAAEAAA